MYLLLNICNDSGILRVFYILKLALNIIFTILPIIVIITSMISIFKVVLNGKSEKMKNSITISFKKIVGGLIVFLLPTIFNYIFTSLVDMNFEIATCITNANLDYIQEREKQEQLEREEERKKTKEEIKEYEAELQEKYEQEMKDKEQQSQNQQNSTGGNLNSNVLTSGKEGKYFAPIQNGSKGGTSASVTGGCGNQTPVYHDMSASIGTPVYAPYDGIAKFIQSNCNGVLYSFGNQVRVFKEDGTYITYAHFSRFPDGINLKFTQDCPYKNSSSSKCGSGNCSAGITSTLIAEKSVKKGQLIGYTGTTGNSLGPHLHVEIHEQGSRNCVTNPWEAFGMR